jgi:hypothetical protein
VLAASSVVLAVQGRGLESESIVRSGDGNRGQAAGQVNVSTSRGLAATSGAEDVDD